MTGGSLTVTLPEGRREVNRKPTRDAPFPQACELPTWWPDPRDPQAMRTGSSSLPSGLTASPPFTDRISSFLETTIAPSVLRAFSLVFPDIFREVQNGT